MPKKRTSKPTAERIMDMLLHVIDVNDGIQGLNVRKIARQARCAPSTIYKHFHNLEGLLWAAMERILQKWMTYSEEHVHPDAAPEEFFSGFITSQIDFALEHSGWYRFMWLEPLPGMPPVQVMEAFQTIYEEFVDMLITLSDNTLDQEASHEAGDMLHGYLHGKICKLLSGRSYLPDKESIKTDIVANTQTLFHVLTTSPQREKEIEHG